jgi:hypothetical protein
MVTLSLFGVEFRIDNEWFELGLTIGVSLMSQFQFAALPLGSSLLSAVTAFLIPLVRSGALSF